MAKLEVASRRHSWKSIGSSPDYKSISSAMQLGRNSLVFRARLDPDGRLAVAGCTIGGHFLFSFPNQVRA